MEEKELKEYMEAYLELVSLSKNQSIFDGLFQKRKQKELLDICRRLGIQTETSSPDQQTKWRAFLTEYARISLESRQYGTTGYGIVPLKGDAVKVKLEEEVTAALVDYPKSLGMKELTAPLYQIWQELEL